MEKINITLEAARVNAGYTQEQAASNLGVSRSTIINWENGKTIPGIPSMHKMSQLYGIPLDCIFLPCYSTNSRIKIKEGSYVNGSGVNITTKTPKITGKGQQYFINKFLQ